MTSEAATPGASGSPMDLVGKTVRWENAGHWYTANVVEWISGARIWRLEVVDPGTFPDYAPGDTAYSTVRRFITVIDSEPDTPDSECE